MTKSPWMDMPGGCNRAPREWHSGIRISNRGLSTPARAALRTALRCRSDQSNRIPPPVSGISARNNSLDGTTQQDQRGAELQEVM
ncbi:hypothetical protein ColLi_13349 [Colletotrichum liriopes]|uniref:Uncharacterized protein n=1 Tax=Colletotrichum liriopes TaxID=708192 RepID=A0AA37H014_9PEZI|nr:hypothetical protein ColLi_13349 [Colletotrichum liriopes]